MQALNKRGLSTVVSAVIVIMISALLAVMIGYGIKEFTEVSLGPAVACTQLQIVPSLSITKACYNAETHDVELMVQRAFDDRGEDAFEISLQSSTGAFEKWSCSNLCGTCEMLAPGETKSYYLGMQEQPSQIIIESNGCSLEQRAVPLC